MRCCRGAARSLAKEWSLKKRHGTDRLRHADAPVARRRSARSPARARQVGLHCTHQMSWQAFTQCQGDDWDGQQEAQSPDAHRRRVLLARAGWEHDTHWPSVAQGKDCSAPPTVTCERCSRRLRPRPVRPARTAKPSSSGSHNARACFRRRAFTKSAPRPIKPAGIVCHFHRGAGAAGGAERQHAHAGRWSGRAHL